MDPSPLPVQNCVNYQMAEVKFDKVCCSLRVNYLLPNVNIYGAHLQEPNGLMLLAIFFHSASFKMLLNDH